MTMDYTNQSRAEIKMPLPIISSTDSNGSGGAGQTKLESYPTTKNHIKRSFDVAFLMLPDEKLKQKQQRLNADAIVTNSQQPQISVKSGDRLKQEHHHQQQQSSPINEHPMRYSISNSIHQQKHHSNNDDLEIELMNNNEQDIHVSRFLTSSTSPASNRSPRIYDDPSIISNGRYTTNDSNSNDAPKSAFTKVPHLRQQESPPLSPDQLSCPSSSPPISSSPPQHIIYQSFRPEYRFVNHGQFQAISQMQAQNQKFKQQFMYRPIHHNSNNNSMENGYINANSFPFGTGGGHPFVTQPDLTGIVRNPAAAALLTTLIPPTIATTFTLTAQNVCAKCNISFRMTSDLVYHMRSHHKSEFTTDTNRRKREEKLKCPVCNESFRERHHLTRHMTAHQDKASDEAETIQMQRRHK